MGVEIALLHPRTNEPGNAAYKHRLLALKPGPVDPGAFPVMTRRGYMAKTGCTVIPDYYNKYRVAFEWVIIRIYSRDNAQNNMREFLEALLAGHQTNDGILIKNA